MATPVAQSPCVYVIAGPNGAGKTTFATEFLPSFANCREFVNADLIAWGLSPFAPETQAVRAGRLVLTRIQVLAAVGADFAIETTLSGRTYAPILARLRERGYRVQLVFLWLPSADLAVARVANRVRQGGHDVPEPAIRRRVDAGPRNFGTLYAPLADDWWIHDASRLPLALVAEHHKEEAAVIVHDPANHAAVVPSQERGMLDEIRHPKSWRIEAACRKASEAVVRRARQTGTPIVTWEDGRIRRASPDRWEAGEPGRSPDDPAAADRGLPG